MNDIGYTRIYYPVHTHIYIYIWERVVDEYPAIARVFYPPPIHNYHRGVAAGPAAASTHVY
jgi:hypothetical protein